MTESERLETQTVFLYFRLLLQTKQDDIYQTEFLDYYPSVNPFVCVSNGYPEYLLNYGDLNEKSWDTVIKGYESLRALCVDNEDKHVCDISEVYIYKQALNNKIPEEFLARVKEQQQSGVMSAFNPFSWDGFDLKDVDTEQSG